MPCCSLRLSAASSVFSLAVSATSAAVSYTHLEPVLSVQEALSEDAHIREREMVVEVELPLSDGKKVTQYGTAVKLSESPAQYRYGGYPVGYHTKEVLKAMGCSDDEIESLTSI